MKILFINTAYFPNMIGGTEYSLKKLAEGLARKHEVSVICASSSSYQEKIVNGIKIYYLQYDFHKRRCIRLFDEIYNHKLLKQTNFLIKKIQPDIVNTNNIFPFSINLWKLIDRNNIPVIHTTRDYYLLGSRYLLKNMYFKHQTRFVYALTAASEYTLKKHIESGLFSKSKMKVVVPNATDINYTYYKNSSKKRTANFESQINFAFMGRYTEDKGISFIVDTFMKWCPTKNARLYFFGRGPLDREINLIAKKQKKIINIGFLDEDNLRVALKDIDVVVVPTTERFEEPFGRVVLDAYMQAIPVIATRVGGLSEIVLDGKTGILIQPSNQKELMNAFDYFLDRRKICATFNHIAIELPKYDVIKQIQRFEEIFTQVLSNGAR